MEWEQIIGKKSLILNNLKLEVARYPLSDNGSIHNNRNGFHFLQLPPNPKLNQVSYHKLVQFNGYVPNKSPLVVSPWLASANDSGRNFNPASVKCYPILGKPFLQKGREFESISFMDIKFGGIISIISRLLLEIGKRERESNGRVSVGY